MNQQPQYIYQQQEQPMQQNQEMLAGFIDVPAKMANLFKGKFEDEGIIVTDIQYSGGAARLSVSDQRFAELIKVGVFENRKKRKKVTKSAFAAVTILAALSGIYTMGASLVAAITGTKLFAAATGIQGIGAGIASAKASVIGAIPFLDSSAAEVASSGWSGGEFSGGGTGLSSSDTNIGSGGGGGKGGFG